jgi:lipopolysaccharide/colanic/teichoic acid biosynthesis glycosyltransferase
MELYRDFGKRSLDLVVSTLLLVALAPLMALISLLVRVMLGSPVFFQQCRSGLGGKAFTLLKYRTMTDARDATGNVLPDPQRQTSLGNLLRRTSLDELPELINVVRGEMSLVGPRPLLMEYLPYYTSREMRRHVVLPGITGLAQVRGRNCTTWEQRFKNDLEYVDSLTLYSDFKIVLCTIRTVMRNDGGLDSAANLGRFRGTVGTDTKCP